MVIIMPKGVPNKKYTSEFKKLVVETMQEEKLGCRETAERFKIHHKQAQAWERIYLSEGPEVFAIERRGRSRTCRARKLPKEVKPANSETHYLEVCEFVE